jgi:ABC-2 type transport system ATP-binding protein
VAGAAATPWEHLQLSARLRRLSDWEDRARDLLERFELGDVAHRVTTGFSHGMGRRLSVCLAALHEPEVLLLDEPFDGVDPIGVDATFDVINDARARGACVLVSTHLRELAVEFGAEEVGRREFITRMAGPRGDHA